MGLIKGVFALAALAVLAVLIAAAIYVGGQLTDNEVTLPDEILDELPPLPTVPSTRDWTTTTTTETTTTTTSTTVATSSTEPAAEVAPTVTVPAYTDRSGDVGDTLTIPDAGGTPISVAVVGIQDGGEPDDPAGATRTVGVFVSYTFHGADPARATPASAEVPRGFLLHDRLGSRYAPAEPTESCPATLPDPVTAGVPASTCVPFTLPGTAPVFALEWYLDPGAGRDVGDLSWIAD